MPRSKRKSVTTKTGISVEDVYCRKCMKTLPAKQFHDAVDKGMLDSNGLLSICKSCINDLFDTIYASERNVQKAVLRMCRMLNIRYSEEAIQSATKQLETYKEKGKDGNSGFFGLYRAKLSASVKSNFADSDESIELTYVEVTQINIPEMPDDAFEGNGKNLKKYWGNNFEKEDYLWLENELAEWKARHKIDTKAEESLLQLIILKRFDIRKSRDEGKDASSLEKEYQALLKTSALSPSMANVANSGDAMDTFGKWIQDIEKEEPAQWLETEGKEKFGMFRDVDDVDGYFMKYFVRSLRNLILQSKDFNIDDEQAEEDEGLIDVDTEVTITDESALPIE